MSRRTSTRPAAVPSRLSSLQDKEAALREKLAAERRKLLRAQAQRQAEERRLKRQQWQAAGQLLEQLGYPLQLDALHERLAQAGAKGSAPSDGSASPVADLDSPQSGSGESSRPPRQDGAVI